MCEIERLYPHTFLGKGLRILPNLVCSYGYLTLSATCSPEMGYYKKGQTPKRLWPFVESL